MFVAKMLKKKKFGFTLLEFLVSMGIVGMIAGITVYALNIRLTLSSTRDAERRQHVRALEGAQMQYLVKNWELLKESEIPVGEANAKPICTQGVTTDATCVNLDALVPDFLVGIPRDHLETNPNYTGFKVYKQASKSYVTSVYFGESSVSKGSGTPEDPYTISTCADLENIQLNVAASYILLNDIDCAGAPFRSIISDFTGTLDGDNFRILNLTFDNIVGYGGIFKKIGSAGTVRSVSLVNATNAAGVLSGMIAGTNAGLIEDVDVAGTLTNGQSSGGVAGANSGIIRRCASSVAVSGVSDLGGIVGSLSFPGVLQDCYATGNVTGSGIRNGGLVGINNGTVKRCYSSGNTISSGVWRAGGAYGLHSGLSNNIFATSTISAPSYPGGIAGLGDSGTNAYWYNQPGDSASACVGNGTNDCTSAPSIASFYNPTYGVYTAAPEPWDFVNIWQSNPGALPTLR